MYKVIVVDEPIICTELKNGFQWEEFGFEFLAEAQNSQEALALFAKRPFDLVITDVCLPGENGLALIAKLQEMYASFSVIILSKCDDFTCAQKAIKLGVSSYLLKPFGRDEFADAIRKVKKELDVARPQNDLPEDGPSVVPIETEQITYRRYYAEEQDLSLFETKELGLGSQQLSKIRLALTLRNRKGVENVVQKYISQLLQSHLSPRTFAAQLSLAIRQITEAFAVCKEQPSTLNAETMSENAFASYSTAQDCINYFYELLNQVLDLHLQKSEKSNTIYYIAEYICQNFEKNITLESLAQTFQLNSNYICQLFKKKLHISFLDFLTTVRIEAAKKHLEENPTLKTYQIAELIGFHDARYFSQVFRKYTGVTPSEYRSRQ